MSGQDQSSVLSDSTRTTNTPALQCKWHHGAPILSNELLAGKQKRWNTICFHIKLLTRTKACHSSVYMEIKTVVPTCFSLCSSQSNIFYPLSWRCRCYTNITSPGWPADWRSNSAVQCSETEWPRYTRCVLTQSWDHTAALYCQLLSCLSYWIWVSDENWLIYSLTVSVLLATCYLWMWCYSQYNCQYWEWPRTRS